MFFLAFCFRFLQLWFLYLFFFFLLFQTAHEILIVQMNWKEIEKMAISDDIYSVHTFL